MSEEHKYECTVCAAMCWQISPVYGTVSVSPDCNLLCNAISAGKGTHCQTGRPDAAVQLAAMTADRDKWMMHSQNLLVSDTVHHVKQSPLSMSCDLHTHTS